MARDLVSDVNENGGTLLKFADHVADAETRQFGSITAVSIEIPSPVYNQLMVFEIPTRENLAAGVKWMASRDVPFWLSMPEAIAESNAVMPEEVALVESDEIAPGMAMASITDIPTTDTDASLNEATDADALEAFIRVFAEAFGVPEHLAEQLYPASILDDPDIRLFVARLDSGLLDVAHIQNRLLRDVLHLKVPLSSPVYSVQTRAIRERLVDLRGENILDVLVNALPIERRCQFLPDVVA